MNRDAKRISSNNRPQIDTIKGYIMGTIRPFDGDGYSFRQAVKELRADGWRIVHRRAMCHYVNLGKSS